MPETPSPVSEEMDIDVQRVVTRASIECALMLMQHGAESALVDELACRVGRTLGASQVDLAISANAIVLTTLFNDRCMTSTRKVIDRGINMHLIEQVQQLVIQLEQGELGLHEVQPKLASITPFRYPRWLMVLVVGMSCGCFCVLNGGSFDAFLVTFVASSSAMFVRQLLTARQINPLINFCFTAFVATMISGMLLKLPIGHKVSSVAMAASVLMLVPGFPLINSVADMFKGHVNTGLARWVMATLLSVAVCIGVSVAVFLVNLQGWL